MKNSFKKLALVLTVDTLLLAGASNLYAGDDVHWRTGDAERQRFVEIDSGSGGHAG